jgi:hypothetical protein
MTERVFKKNIVYRLSAYLLLLPFIPAVRPVLNDYEIQDLIIFICGFILTIVLILLSNNKPYIRLTDKNISIYLVHHHKPEIHNLLSIENVTIISDKVIRISSRGFKPLEIRLSKKEQIELLALLEDKEVPVSKADRK